MRTYSPNQKIALYPNIYKILPKIIDNSRQVFVVTNGNVIQQKNKKRNIEWNFLDKKLTFIYANEFKKKPSKESFNYIKKRYMVEENSTIMIGDSIFDEKFAENCKIDFMFVKNFNTLIN